MRLGRLVTLSSLLLIPTLAVACGGEADQGEARPAGTEAPSAAAPRIDPSELVDVSTIGQTNLEAWARQADAWASSALDEANTVGELLGERGTKRRILRGQARDVRSRVDAALVELRERCQARAQEVPAAPAEYEEAARKLDRACERFSAAGKQLTSSFASGNGKAFERGIEKLAAGVNAIGAAYELIGPSLR